MGFYHILLSANDRLQMTDHEWYFIVCKWYVQDLEVLLFKALRFMLEMLG